MLACSALFSLRRILSLFETNFTYNFKTRNISLHLREKFRAKKKTIEGHLPPRMKCTNKLFCERFMHQIRWHLFGPLSTKLFVTRCDEVAL
jgi:hypothetical protein